MTLPTVTITSIDGALGVLPPATRRPLVVMGPATSGTAGVVTPLTRSRDVYTTFGAGPMPELACYAIENFGLQVICIKTAATTAGSAGTIDVTGVTGTSVITDGSSTPTDDFDVWGRIMTGGTRGTGGIVFRVSLDGGRNWGPSSALGTDITISSSNCPSLANTGVSFAVGAGTLVAGDTWKLRCTAPACQSSDLTTPIANLKASALTWEGIALASPIDATIAGVLDTLCSSLESRGQFHFWMGNARLPTAGETEAQYLTAMGTAFSSYSANYGVIAAGSAFVNSALPAPYRANSYRAPVIRALAAKIASVSEEVDVAQIDAPGGTLPGVNLYDTTGASVHHDEEVNPGLDDLRLTTLRTWAGYAGTYVTNARIKSAAGSDFEFAQHRRVMGLFAESVYRYFVRRLSKAIRVNKATGFILEADAQEIEGGAAAVTSDVMLQRPKASGVQITLKRDDNLISTKTLTVDARVVPLAYPKAINITLGFLNPALRAQ